MLLGHSSGILIRVLDEPMPTSHGAQEIGPALVVFAINCVIEVEKALTDRTRHFHANISLRYLSGMLAAM